MKNKLIVIVMVLSLLIGLAGVVPASAAANTWAALANDGLNGNIRAMVTLGDYLYVGGDFTATADGSVTNLNHIARYNLKTKIWSAMDENGLNGPVHALAVLGTDLYAGGDFTASMGGAVLNNIAKYDTVNNLVGPLSEDGLNSTVRAFTVNGNTLIVGGDFSQTGNGTNANLHRIAKYRTDTNTWYSLPDKGLNGSVFSLLVKGNYLYVGGAFSQSYGGATNGLNNIARHHLLGVTWSALPGNGLNDIVLSITSVDDELYIGGGFTKNFTQTQTLNYIAQYDAGTNSWLALPNNSPTNWVYSMIVNGDDLYVGGGFKTPDYWHITRYSRTKGTWSAFGDGGTNDYVRALAIKNGELYVGGDFTNNAMGTTPLIRIARFTIHKTASFKSTGANDGWVLETGENTNVGGTMNATATTLRIGDDAARKQYRSVLSFATSSLPDNAVVTKVTLKVKQQGIVGGGNPVNMFQGFLADIRKGTFGTSALQLGDWQTAASKTIGPLTVAPSGGWYTLNLTAGRNFVNKLASGNGLTQIRLRFKLDDNNNSTANYLSIYSGNAAAADRPKLIIEYYIP